MRRNGYPGTQDLALSLMDARSATGGAAARSANTFPQIRAGLLDCHGTRRGKKPPGPPHDRLRGPSDPAPDARADRGVLARKYASRSLERTNDRRKTCGA